MQLHTVDGDHHVGTQRFAVKIDRKPVLQVTNTFAFHIGYHRDPETFLCHTIACKHGALPLRRSSSMTSHSGEDEWDGSKLCQPVNCRLDDYSYIGDPPTSDRDRNPHPRPDLFADVRAGQLCESRPLHVLDLIRRKELTDAMHPRQAVA